MCIIFLPWTCATWYYNAIYIVFTYFASFTSYEEDIFEVISNLHVQGSKFDEKFDKFGGKPLRKLNSVEFMKLVIFKSVLTMMTTSKRMMKTTIKKNCLLIDIQKKNVNTLFGIGGFCWYMCQYVHDSRDLVFCLNVDILFIFFIYFFQSKVGH